MVQTPPAVLYPVGGFNGKLFLWKAFMYWNLLFIEELSFLLNDQKKRNKKKSPANILDYPLMA